MDVVTYLVIFCLFVSFLDFIDILSSYMLARELSLYTDEASYPIRLSA